MPRTGDTNSKVARFGRIAVLCGGPSSEREISRKSGRAVFDALKKHGLDCLFLDVRTGAEKAIRNSKAKTAFIALHGRFGEDGTVQNMLGRLGIRYTGSDPKASRLALDKIASRRIFKKMDIPVPKYSIIRKGASKSLDLNFPVVVKPQFEGSSIGLSVADKIDDLPKALNSAYKYGDSVIVEEYIKGREITVGILAERPLPPVEIIPDRKCYDFFAKYKDRLTKYLVPAPIKRKQCKEAQRLALIAHKSLGCRSFSRVDMILGGNGRFYVLEVNSIPGLTQRSLLPKAAGATGINFENLCVKILEGATKK